MSERFWNLETGEQNVLEIMHEIDSADWWGDSVTPEAFRGALSQCSGELSVLINSPGGDTFAAADIYTALREYSASRGRVICYITGIAASAASMIAMAGDTVYISDVGMLMIHDPWTAIAGNAEELRELADVLDVVRDAVATAYAAKTGKSMDEIRRMMAATSYMDAPHAVAHGFCDGVAVYSGPPRKRAQSSERGSGEVEQMRTAALGLRDKVQLSAQSGRMRAAQRLKARCV